MRDGVDHARLDRLCLIDEHLYDAYRRAQRTCETREQHSIADQIREMQRERSALLENLLSVSEHR
jgi:hypothetical protein